MGIRSRSNFQDGTDIERDEAVDSSVDRGNRAELATRRNSAGGQKFATGFSHGAERKPLWQRNSDDPWSSGPQCRKPASHGTPVRGSLSDRAAALPTVGQEGALVGSGPGAAVPGRAWRSVRLTTEVS